MTLTCFERALALAEDDNMSDIWYNVGQVAIGIGDLGLANQAFKVSISLNPKQAEALNNLGVQCDISSDLTSFRFWSSEKEIKNTPNQTFKLQVLYVLLCTTLFTTKVPF